MDEPEAQQAVLPAALASGVAAAPLQAGWPGGTATAAVLTPSMLAALAPVTTGAPSPAAPDSASRGHGGRGRGRGGKRKSTPKHAAAAPGAVEMTELPSPPKLPGQLDFKDPGGRLIWAKVGDYPWWPAKQLDRRRDISFPSNAEPPSNNAVPVRFFGTFEFEWMDGGAVVSWEEGLASGLATADDQESLRAAVAEVEAYQQTGRLPDVFYARPKPVKRSGGPKRQQQQQQHKRKGGSGTAAHLPPEQLAEFIAQRQKRIRQQLGLQPPDGSPWTEGRICPNPLLEAKLAEWRAAGLLPAAP